MCMLDQLADKNPEGATETLIAILRAAWLDGFMSQTRRQWQPGGFAGCQHADTKPYVVLQRAITDAISEIDNRD